MTSTYKLAAGLGMIITLLSLSVYAQSAGPKLNKFAKDGILFDYPAEYSVTDESTDEAQQLILARSGSSVQLTIVAARRFTLRNELPAAIENFTEPLIKKVAVKLGGEALPERTSIKTQIGLKEAEGVRLRSSGSSNRTAEVIWLRLKFRPISLAVIRSDEDGSAGSQLWQTIRSSLKVEAPVVVAVNTDVVSDVLNGKALALPQPEYPAIARGARAAGTVTVRVIIDEQGNVSAARAVDGHPLLQAVSVAAARQAKFSPTFLEGEPVRVTGVIKYNFRAR